MKKALTLIAAVLTAGVLFGQTQTTNTLATQAAAYRDSTIIADQNQIPDQDNRSGYLFVVYNFAKHGGAVGTYALSDALPNNTYVKDGYVQVITPISPATSTGALSVVTSGDLIAEGTTLQSAGITAVTPGSLTSGVTNGVNAGIVTATSTNRVEFSITGSAATAGVFVVRLNLDQVQ